MIATVLYIARQSRSHVVKYMADSMKAPSQLNLFMPAHDICVVGAPSQLLLPASSAALSP